MSCWTYINGNIYITNNLSFYDTEKEIKLDIERNKKYRKKMLKSVYLYLEKLKSEIQLGGDRDFLYFINPIFKDNIGKNHYDYDDNINISIQSRLRNETNCDGRINNLIKKFLYKIYYKYNSHSVVDVIDTFGREFITNENLLPDKVFIFNEQDNISDLENIIPNAKFDWKEYGLRIDNKLWTVEYIFEHQQEFEKILNEHNIKYIIKNV